MLLLILAVLFVLAVAGGSWVTPRYGPYVSNSPAVAIVLIIIVLFLAGYIH